MLYAFLRRAAEPGGSRICTLVIVVIAGHVPGGSDGTDGNGSRTQADVESMETNTIAAKAIEAGHATTARMSRFYRPPRRSEPDRHYQRKRTTFIHPTLSGNAEQAVRSSTINP